MADDDDIQFLGDFPSTSKYNSSKKPKTEFMPTSKFPPYSAAALQLFLKLPRYREVLLENSVGSCMLRVYEGEADASEANDLFSSEVASSVPLAPFKVLQELLDLTSEGSEEGMLLRLAMIELKVLHLVLDCLAVFTRQNWTSLTVPKAPADLIFTKMKDEQKAEIKTEVADSEAEDYAAGPSTSSKTKWAKGTGYGSGSTTTKSWDIEKSLADQKQEEEEVICLMDVLSSYISSAVRREAVGAMGGGGDHNHNNVESSLPMIDSKDLFMDSCLFSVIAAYLRNDSVLDMCRHTHVHRSVLQVLRFIVLCPDLRSLLIPSEIKPLRTESYDNAMAIPDLLMKMKDAVDLYASRVMPQPKRGLRPAKRSQEDLSLGELISDIQKTAVLVQDTIKELTPLQKVQPGPSPKPGTSSGQANVESIYTENMKKIQFSFYDMVAADENSTGIKLTVNHHYANNFLKQKGAPSVNARMKRLVQEVTTLRTSLPLSHGSSVFVRCDTDRFDIMKILITGPVGTPYANGCFEFDLFFPNNYPTSPPQMNLETNGRKTVRFNPNLYADGKVCLSILNTWNGRPEERWNPQTSSLLPVLVAIQSLILTPEPYYNEPGFESMMGTPGGELESRNYNARIQAATVQWAMVEQLKNPSPCFKDVIENHFSMKKDEILAQCQQWIKDCKGKGVKQKVGNWASQTASMFHGEKASSAGAYVPALEKYTAELKTELDKLKPK